MILQSTTIRELADLLAPHMEKPAWPGITDPGVKARARDHARKSGLWEKIDAELDPAREIPTLKRSSFRDYARNGSREKDEASQRGRVTETQLAALALWLEHPKANLDYFQDLVWAWCETTWWKFAAHEPQHIDLVSSTRARELAEFSNVFGDQLEPEVRERISREVANRVLDVALDYKYPDWWRTTGNNWNTVCNANLITTALYEIKDPARLAAFIHPVCRRMDYAIDYYTEDGGCVEGVGYWGYGFCYFVDAAIVLQHRTGGAINLMNGKKIERICRFPLSAFLRAPVRASFADGGHGYIGMGDVLRINHFFQIPELFQCVSPATGGVPEIPDMRTFCLYNGEKPLPYTDRTDAMLPELGYAKANAAASDVVLAALAGSNDVSHNHNDIGSFLLVKNGVALLTDPGTPVYSAKTFGPQRYEMLVCRSLGHSVPVINGYEQREGSAFRGTITAEGLNGKGDKIVVIDFSKAYPDPTLRRLLRTFTVRTDGSVKLEDSFEFDELPEAVEEAFITYEPVFLENGIAKVGSEKSSATITPQIAGDFELETYSPEEHEGRDMIPLHRIKFIPRKRERIFSLAFEIQ